MIFDLSLNSQSLYRSDVFLLSGYVVNALVLSFCFREVFVFFIDLVFLMQNFDCHPFKFGSEK